MSWIAGRIIMQKKLLTKDQALQKLRQYCGYQERSHYEVKQKLWEIGSYASDHDEIISTLIEEDYLKEDDNKNNFI